MVEIKKIVTRGQQEKKRKRNYIIIGIVLVLLMVISPAGYSFLREDSSTQNSNVAEYKGTKFFKDDRGYWQFQYAGKNFVTRYNSLELNETKVSTGLYLTNYNNQVLYFEYNESREGADEIAYNLFELNQIPKRVWRACFDENCSIDAPIKSCSEDKIISFREPLKGEKERVYKEENCVFIVANQTNQLKYSDAFLYDIIGI